MHGRMLTRMLIAACLLVWAAACGCNDYVDSEWTDDTVTFHKPGYPDGQWTVTVEGFTNAMQPGDPIDWTLRFSMTGENLEAFLPEVESLGVALAARRMADENGRYRDQDAYFTSTYLTPGGLPVEGYQYFIANSTIGGPYRTPLDHAQILKPDALVCEDGELTLTVPIRTALAADFPPGLYRVEIALFASCGGGWLPLHVLRVCDQEIGFSLDYDYEGRFFDRLYLPPMTVGEIAQPRAIWTLFSRYPNSGVSGAVAREDSVDFAMTNRVKPQVRYTLPCTPDRSECVYRIEPDLPTIFKSTLFRGKQTYSNLLEPDFDRGSVSVVVRKPDGSVADLGTHPLVSPPLRNTGLHTDADELAFSFDQFGRYEIEMTGEMFDRFGNRYEAGGTYEVWVAYPLTFATGIKPGTPMNVGGRYPTAATINPGVPADVTASVRFFPALHPDDERSIVQHGKAQRFGYFFPAATEPNLTFSEEGEYLYEIFATFTDSSGRLFMGNMRNAGVVTGDALALTVNGAPVSTYSRDYDTVESLDGRGSESIGSVVLPRESGGVIYFAGNGNTIQTIEPAVSITEPTGELRRVIDENFPPTMVNLATDPAKRGSFHLNYFRFPGCQALMRPFGPHYRDDDHLPLMGTTPEGYSPHEYPERVDRRGYFYIATSRPGFPVYFVIADSTLYDSYWNNAVDDYFGTVGASFRGDQPGDVHWNAASGMFADTVSGRAVFGSYGSGAVGLYRGDASVFESAAFERPVATVNGVDLYIYGGVGPSPGTIYETGAVKGVGSIAVPMAPHEVLIDVHKPSGTVHHCRGRADLIGNFFCPAGPLVLDEPGVYRVFTKFWEGDKTGNCAGSRDGWYSIYAVEKDSDFRVVFDVGGARLVDTNHPLSIAGRVEPPLAEATAHYSVVAPGILMDEGELPVTNGEFEFDFRGREFLAEFQNLHGQLVDVMRNRPFGWWMIPLALKDFVFGSTETELTDTVEITVFVEGKDADGNDITAGGKFVLRGRRVVIPRVASGRCRIAGGLTP